MGKKKHFLEQVKDRYSLFENTTFISNEKCFFEFISEACPDFAHKGPREYPLLVEVVKVNPNNRPILGFVYTEQVQRYIFDRKLT
jgi:hypothetical protein